MGESRIRGRSEAWVLLPIALLTLVILSTYTLFHERGTISLLLAERRQEAEQLARWMSRRLSGGGLPNDDDLRRLQGVAVAVTVLDADGVPLAVSGDPSVRTQIVTGEARLELSRPDLRLRVDLSAATLRGRERALAILTPLVLGVDGAILLLVLFYLRRLLTPFDRLLQRARRAGRVPEASGDEVAFLVATLEEAFDSLASPVGKQAEADGDGGELEALERTLGRSLESGVLLCDRQGRILSLNPLGADLLGVEPEPGIGLAEALPEQPELAEILLAAMREERGVGRQDFTLRAAPGGAERTLGLTMHPLRRDDHGVRGYLTLFIDLTVIQRRAREERISENLARLGELAAGVAHEMRNSLATLRGYLTLVERGGERETIDEYVEEIRHETDHLGRVVDDFLAFARPGSARMEHLALAPLLERAAADPALGAAVETEIEADLRATGDAQLLERAVVNLLRNAVEAQREFGVDEPVWIRARRLDDGEEIEISIEDRGGGVPEEIRERLFHPFATHRADGVGLGLALTHRIVELHGGRLRLADRPEGGTRAEMLLPAGAIVSNRHTSD